MEIEIRSASGQLICEVPICTGAKGYFSLMQHDYIELPFTLAEPVAIGVGSYVDMRGVFDDALGGKLRKIYYVTDVQDPTWNSSTGGYDYRLRLNAYYWLWNNHIFKYMPESTGAEVSWSLTGPLEMQMGVFLRNLKALGFTYDGRDFTCVIDGTVAADKSVAMAYDSTRMLDALFSMGAEDKWDCDVWITGSEIHFGRLENGDAVKIEAGVEATGITRSESKGTYATRIYAFGSTRNIPQNYRQSDSSMTVDGIVQKRLMLPEGTPYVDARPGLRQEEIVEGVLVRDDIYPKYIGELSDIEEVPRELEGGDTVDEDAGDGTGGGESAGDESQGTFTAYQYKDPGLNFKKEYIIEGQELRIVFQSGRLNGMDFGVIFEPEGTEEGSQTWEIRANEDYGRLLPDDTLRPGEGDKYILYGFDTALVSDQYLPDAEQELLQCAIDEAAKANADDGTYTVTLRWDWVKEDEINRTFDAGQRLKLVNPGMFPSGSRTSRVIGWEMNLDYPYDAPVYHVGESTAYSRIGDMQSQIESIAYKGATYTRTGGGSVYIIRTNDSTVPSNDNVFSALRSLATFLRKDKEDSTKFLLGLLGGAIFGRDGYASGLTGFGAKIDEGGNGEMESLTLRRFLEVPELRYNRTEISIGDKWRAPGAGIIESVTIDTLEEIINGETVISELPSGTITLHLEDGELGAVAVDDICMGIFHDWKTPGNNATEDTDDSLGNRTFAGFCTVYFRITEILDEDNKTFKYTLRGTSGTWKHQFHPCEAMHFVSYGNFTNPARRTSVYETRTYTRMLVNQQSWEFVASNIAMQWGDLSNLSVFGLQMSGYSAYLNNIYMSGTIEQGIETPYRIEIETSSDQFLELGESLAVTAKVYHGWEDITETIGENFTISRESSDSSADSQWAQGSKAQSFKATGKIILSYSTAGNDMGADFSQNGTLFTFGANLPDGGSVSTQLLVRPLPKGEPGQSGQDGQDAVRRWLVVAPDTINKADLGTARVKGTKMEQTGNGEAHESDYGVIMYRYLRNGGQTTSVWFPLTGNTFDVLFSSSYDGMEVRFCESNDPNSTLIDSKSVVVVSNGEQGDPGEDGQPSTSYWIAADPEMVVFAESDGLTQNKSCTFTAWSQTGTVAPAVFTGGRLTYATSDNPAETEADTDTGSFGVMFRLNGGIPERTWAIARLYVGDTVVASKTVNLDQGINGCIVRTSEWVEGVQYRNDTQYLFTGLGQKYLDVAIITKSATEFEAYQCKVTHTSTASTKPGSGAGWQSYWTKFNMMAPIYTPLIMAENGVIRFMQSNRIFVMQSDGLTVAAAFAGGDWPLWIGAQEPEDAPFKVSIKGKLFATGAEITGDSKFSGTLEGVTGSFESLTSVKGGTAKISFSTDDDPKLWFYGDLQHQGAVNDRNPRFMSGDIWCRGYFGAKQRIVVQLMMSGSQIRARYITEWNNTGPTKYVDILINPEWEAGVKSFTVPCFGDSPIEGPDSPIYDFGDVAGMPVDTVLLYFPHQGGTSSFNIILDMWPTQRVLVANIPSSSYPINLYVNGLPVSIEARTVREVVCFPPNMISSSLTPTTWGAGQLVGAFGTTEI